MKKQSKTIKISTSPSGQDLTTGVKVRNHPTSEQIRQRAYEIHKSRAGDSHPVVDWFQAKTNSKRR